MTTRSIRASLLIVLVVGGLLLTGCGDDGDSETDASAADDSSSPSGDDAPEPADDEASEPADEAEEEDDEAAAAGGEFCESFELDAVSEATGTDMEIDELSTFEDSCAFESTDHAVRLSITKLLSQVTPDFSRETAEANFDSVEDLDSPGEGSYFALDEGKLVIEIFDGDDQYETTLDVPDDEDPAAFVDALVELVEPAMG